MKTLRQLAMLVLIFVVFFLTAGCGDSNPTNSFEPSVSNTTDDFIFRASNVYMVTTRLTYNWTNTGHIASIEHRSSRSGGTGNLVILDSEGEQVYQSQLKLSDPDAHDITIAGNPGEWSVVVNLNEYSGSIYFRIRKA